MKRRKPTYLHDAFQKAIEDESFIKKIRDEMAKKEPSLFDYVSARNKATYTRPMEINEKGQTILTIPRKNIDNIPETEFEEINE